MNKLKSVIIFPNENKDINNVVAKKVISYLLQASCTVYSAKVNKRTLGEIEGVIYENESKILEKCDIAVVIGGDGSILKAASACAPFGVDILGINLGKVGYMAGMESSEISTIGQLINSDYEVESRMMLDIAIERKGELIFSGGPVLNDVVLAKSKGYGVIECELSCDGAMLSIYRGDGLIVATPTGSTAYSMSAGGPIIDYLLDCICTTPICAHSLKSRPLIFKDGVTIEISCNSKNNSACVTLDGAIAFDIEDKDVIIIKKSNCRARLLKTSDKSFCSVLYSKIAER